MTKQLAFVLRPNKADTDGVNMVGYISDKNDCYLGETPYEINIGTKTNHKFQVTSHDSVVGSFDAKKLRTYLEHRGVDVGGDFVDGLYDVMQVIRASQDGFAKDICKYIHNNKTHFECSADAELSFELDVLDRIKKDVKIRKSLNNYHAQFGKLGGFITQEVRDVMDQRNYPSLNYLIEDFFIKDDAELRATHNFVV